MMPLSLKKALLALLLAPCSPSVSAQKDIIRAPKEEFEKVPPVYPNKESDESNRRRRRRRRLDLSTAVHYPNPCMDLPANRVPDLNDNTTANDGWTLALLKTDAAVSGNLPLPFTFTLNGQSYHDALSVANDGYLFFPGSTTGTALLDRYFLFVFWSNVDTRGWGGTTSTTDGGYVWRKNIGDNKFAVAWDNVGYFDRRTDKLNTYQVLLSDGTDASMGLGNNVCYCYQDMQYTTGGYGYVGVDKGGDIGGDSYAPFGLFTETGEAYDGGYGNNDGFDYLENKSICFKASGSNIPPVAVNVPNNNRIDLACGESLTNLTIFLLAPENGQAVTLTSLLGAASAGLTVAVSEQTNQSTATATINWAPTAAAMVNVTLTASDGIDATTVNLTFTASGSSCCTGTTAEIWNPTTNKFVRALVNGSKYCLKKYNLRAVPCPAGPVVLELWNRRGTRRILLKRKKDFVPPYFLWGDKINTTTGFVDVKPNPKALPNGNYALRIKAITNATSTTNASSSFYTETRFKQSCP